MVFMIGTQILWSAYALAYDHSHEYYPDLAASKFLQPLVRDGAKIAVTYLDEPFIRSWDAVGILPYFDHNIYMNWPNSFWSWSANDPTEESFLAALPTQPRIVLVETTHWLRSSEAVPLESLNIQTLTKAGYKLTNVFCGARSLRFEEGASPCHLIFQHF
jgi:hypothetical protein